MSPIESTAAVFTAIGTVAVAIVAIWGNWIRARLAGPSLSVMLRNERGDLTIRGDGTRELYHHVIVRNGRHWSPAEAVRVVIVGLAHRRPDGSFFPESLVVPLQLTWAFAQFHELLPTVADSPETCDFGAIDEHSRRFRLTTYFTPNNFRGYIDAGEAMRVTLQAQGHNGKSEPLVLEVFWDGQWSPDSEEMQRHLVINEVAIH